MNDWSIHGLTFAQELDQAITAYVASVEKEVLQSLAVTMRIALPEIAQKAYNFLHDEVRGWFWSTIRAFIDRRGTYRSKAVGFVDWNSKLRRPAVRHMRPGWTELFLKEKEHMTTAESKCKENLDVLHHDVKGMVRSLLVLFASSSLSLQRSCSFTTSLWDSLVIS